MSTGYYSPSAVVLARLGDLAIPGLLPDLLTFVVLIIRQCMLLHNVGRGVGGLTRAGVPASTDDDDNHDDDDYERRRIKMVTPKSTKLFFARVYEGENGVNPISMLLFFLHALVLNAQGLGDAFTPLPFAAY